MKAKTHSATKKRVKITGRKKIRLQKSCKQHLLINKSKKMKNASKGGQGTSKGNEAVIRRLLPHST